MFEIQDNAIIFSNGKRAQFADNIAEIVDFDEIVVVRLENQGWNKTNENVLGVDHQGRVLWRIAPRAYTISDCSYVQVQRHGEFVDAYGWDGRVITLEPKTGFVLSENWVDVGGRECQIGTAAYRSRYL